MISVLSPREIPADRLVHSEVLRGGCAWSRRLLRHQVLRLTDASGGACVSALFYNAREPLERYNMPDTLKAQYTAFVTTGRVLYSDMGRVLMSVVGDTCGWHDTLSGCGDAAASRARFGAGSYQERRNDFFRNARDNFLVELGKHGLGKRDLGANVNFFVRVGVDTAGRMTWTAGHSRPRAHVDLRCEMDTLVVLSNTPHPLDPGTVYAPPPVELAVWRGDAPGPEDPCRVSRPENTRGFALTEAYLAEVGS
jgi:urea carboxylase-associated protein 2